MDQWQDYRSAVQRVLWTLHALAAVADAKGEYGVQDDVLQFYNLIRPEMDRRRPSSEAAQLRGQMRLEPPLWGLGRR